jgi:hypothetical protein
MVTAVRVAEYDGEPKHIRVTVKVPTDLPAAEWQSKHEDPKPQRDEFTFSMPLDAAVRPGDLIGVDFIVEAPTEVNRFRPALEVSVEGSLIAEAKENE